MRAWGTGISGGYCRIPRRCTRTKIELVRSGWMPYVLEDGTIRTCSWIGANLASVMEYKILSFIYQYGKTGGRGLSL